MAASTKKDRLLGEAQKLALRGQFDKALKIYEQLLVMEPTAINLRQKLAELLTRVGRTEDARREFETIGTYYSKNGFYLKAIAVYKQLQKLFPADISLSLTLAELNEKHGLAANALSEYKRVHDYYELTGNHAEAIKILDRMQNVDPRNIPIKIKLAEAYLQHGKKDEAYALFSRTAALLQERGEHATVDGLNTRIQELFPEKTGFVLEVLAEQVTSGNAASALDGLQRLLRSNPNDKRVWDLIIAAYKQLDQPQRVRIAYQHYLGYFPAEPAVMAGLIACLITAREPVAALELLDRYETDLISAGLRAELEAIYRGLEALDPLNRRILEGLVSIVTARGNDSEAEALASRLHTLHFVAGDECDPEAGTVSLEERQGSPATPSGSPSTADIQPGQSGPSVSNRYDVEEFTGMISADAADQSQWNPVPPEDNYLEIEIDIDIDSAFGPSPDEKSAVAGETDWLDSAGDIFESISTAPRGVRFGNEMDSSDAQSHYDLGLAFKEMGLYDEAINEFRQASSDPMLRMGCLVMQGACLRERGELEKALSMLHTLLKPGLRLEDACAVQYELVITYEALGKTEEASALLNEIDSANPGFRDVSSRINSASHESSLDFSDEELQEFGPK